MSVMARRIRHRLFELVSFACVVLAASATLAPPDAQALPLFARQTGQNCVSCHAGGQFPELTPYGRMFKLTGYTIGARVAVPISVMGVLSSNKTKNTDDTLQGGDPTTDFPKDGNPIFQTGSVFFGGKITDNLGAFVQFTYDNYASRNVNGSWSGHDHSDNVDIRYADRFISPSNDLVVGLSVNNNPSAQDVWNSAPAWLGPYVPGASPSLPISPIVSGMGQNVVGLGGYVYWNQSVYAELSGYRTADKGIRSWFSRGSNTNLGNQSFYDGLSPYWRVALTHEWGPHNLMVGAFGLTAKQFVDPVVRDPADANKYRDQGLDAQYQYLLDPHTLTAQVSYIRERISYGSSQNSNNASANFLDPASTLPLPNNNDNDTLKFFRSKLTYVYQAKYGGSLTYFNVNGTYNALNQSVAYDGTGTGTLVQPGSATGNFSGKPDTNGFIYEAFWTPVQYVRVGAQYTSYRKFNGASDNYDGFGRSAKDNNTMFFYVWGAY